jgi:osmoprotectant transport system substrate-binding protein
MRRTRMLALGASLLVLASACTTGGGSPTPNPTTTSSPATATASPTQGTPPTVRIGSANFYEAQLVAELYAQMLEAHGYTVQRTLGIGARDLVQKAIQGSQVDLVPEYIGSALEFLNKGKGEATGDPAANAAKLQTYLTPLGITELGYSWGQDQNGFAVRQDTATADSLATMSDLAKVSATLVLGAPPECETNPVCLPALKAVYGIQFKDYKKLGACGPDGITALVNKAIDVYEVCTTQPGISQFDLVLLADDKHVQPAENIAPLVRDDFLAKLPDPTGFKALLNEVSGGLSTQFLLSMGVEVDVQKKDVADVAKEWLTQRGLIP